MHEFEIAKALVNVGAIGAVALLSWNRLTAVTDRFLDHLKSEGEASAARAKADVEAREHLAAQSAAVAAALQVLERSMVHHETRAEERHRDLMHELRETRRA